MSDSSSTISYPPTVVVRSPRENPRKCSILPLKDRPDIIFLVYPAVAPVELANYVRLAAEGPALSIDDAKSGILLLDGSWRRADSMMRDFVEVPPRSLRGFRTAYPRVSKRGSDPDNGLASVEALFLAYQILGRPTVGMLDHYHWRDEFLRHNADLLPGLTGRLP